MQTDPPLVAGLVTALAPCAAEEGKVRVVGNAKLGKGFLPIAIDERVVFVLGRMVALLAVLTNGAGQPLSQHPQQRVGKVEGVHAHL